MRFSRNPELKRIQKHFCKTGNIFKKKTQRNFFQTNALLFFPLNAFEKSDFIEVVAFIVIPH